MTQRLDCSKQPFECDDAIPNEIVNMFNCIKHPLLDIVVDSRDAGAFVKCMKTGNVVYTFKNKFKEMLEWEHAR